MPQLRRVGLSRRGGGLWRLFVGMWWGEFSSAGVLLEGLRLPSVVMRLEVYDVVVDWWRVYGHLCWVSQVLRPGVTRRIALHLETLPRFVGLRLRGL